MWNRCLFLITFRQVNRCETDVGRDAASGITQYYTCVYARVSMTTKITCTCTHTGFGVDVWGRVIGWRSVFKAHWTIAGMWGYERERGPGCLCRINTQRSLISARKTSQKHNNKDLIESPTVTVTWHASKYKVHKPYQRHILRGSMSGQNIHSLEVKGGFIIHVTRRFRLEEDWAKMKWKEKRKQKLEQKT